MSKRVSLVFCLLSSLLLMFRADASIKKVFQVYSSRIVNGTRAKLGQFPQQVSLREIYTQNPFCGGTILSSEWIISAAHCMFDKYNNTRQPSEVLIVAGEILLKDKRRSHAWSEGIEIIVHPEFDNVTLQNDVALIKLKTPLKFDCRVRPATIIPQPVKPFTLCEVSGWGLLMRNGSGPTSYLMYVKVPVMSDRLCRALWGNYYVPKGTFCAGYLNGGRDACIGDSGGGLMCNGYLAGQVSGGSGCAEPKTPGLYADVNYFLPWIRRYVDLEQRHAVEDDNCK